MPMAKASAGVYLLGSVAMVGAVIWSSLQGYPPLPPATTDPTWAFQWLVLTVVNYTLAALSLSSIITATDGLCGLVWSLVSTGLGGTFFCLYCVLRLQGKETLALKPLPPGRTAAGGSSNAGVISKVFLAVVGVAFLGFFTWTQINYPLVPPLVDDAAWSSQWVITTIGDYSTVAICLCVIVMWTEETIAAAAWCVAILLTGGIGASAYVAYRIATTESIELASGADDKLEAATAELSPAGIGG